MKTIIDKSLILNKLKDIKNFNSDKELADFLDIRKSTLSNWYSRNSIDYDLLFSKCEPEEISEILNLSHKDLKSDNIVNEQSSQYLQNVLDDDVIYLDQNKEPEIFLNERTGNKYLLYPDGTIRIEVLKVPFVAYASYIEVFDDEVRLNEEFSKITFKVDHIGRGRYLGFESKGNSMWNEGGYDTPSGADMLGREVGRHLWMNGFNKSKYGFILITNTGMFHKDIEKLDDQGHLFLSSRNPNDLTFQYPINDVKEIYHVIKRSF